MASAPTHLRRALALLADQLRQHTHRHKHHCTPHPHTHPPACGQCGRTQPED